MQTDASKFWEFSRLLFDKQTDFFDANVVNETRNKTYERLAKIAGSTGLDEKKIYSKLEISDKPDKDGGLNVGNQVTNDLKPLIKVSISRDCMWCMLTFCSTTVFKVSM